MAKEFVQLVDSENQETGIMEKMEAHRLGMLHRAISVLIFNSKNELLLQQRALGKYHSAGLWSNTCCTHPAPGEQAEVAAQRRLKEEMGLSCPLFNQFNLLYKAEVGKGLTEYEYDQVFFGYMDDIPTPNPDEAVSWIYLPMEEIDRWLAEAPESFTPWFPLLYDQAKFWIS